MKIVLLGAPGCGKGTQASLISKNYNLPHISTGDIFRENIKNKTPLGIQVKEIMDRGNLCPDDLTIKIVEDRLNNKDCIQSYLLDGFPRNITQAEALEKFNPPDVVININVDLDKIEKRVTGRRICSKCGHSFHIDFIGDVKFCPGCKGELFIREDDNVNSVRERLSVYKRSTEPLIDLYTKLNKLINIDGNQTIEQVFEQIQSVLTKYDNN